MESADDRLVHIRLDEREQGVVAHATINNAGHLNAMNSALMQAFVDAMARLATDERLRAVVLTGAGRKAFIVGADINEMAAIESAAQATAFITCLHRCCQAIRDLPVPVIARIQGYTFGGGLELAAACDVRIASEGAIFGMPEVKLGMPSVIEAALLPMLIGWGRTRELLLLGETFTAAEAHVWGLVEHVVPGIPRCGGRGVDRQTHDLEAAGGAAAKAADPAMGDAASGRSRGGGHRHIRGGAIHR